MTCGKPKTRGGGAEEGCHKGCVRMRARAQAVADGWDAHRLVRPTMATLVCGGTG